MGHWIEILQISNRRSPAALISLLSTRLTSSVGLLFLTAPLSAQFDDLPAPPPLPPLQVAQIADPVGTDPPQATPPRQADGITSQGSAKSSDTRTAGGGRELDESLRKLEQAIVLLEKKDAVAAERMRLELKNVMRQFSARAAKEATAAGRAEQVPPQSVSRFTRPRPSFESANKAIERLEADGDAVTSKKLRTQLKEMQDGIAKGEYALPVGLDAEVHHVSIGRGSILPSDLRTDDNRLNTGYAEVHVGSATRPVILCLSSREPTLWKVTTNPKVVVQAVILDTSTHQSVIGLDNVLVIDSRKAISNGFVRTNSGTTWHGRYGMLYQLAGGEPVTHFSDDSWSGEPIVIGKGNPDWLAARLTPMVDQVIEQARATLQRRQSERLQDMRFTATFRSGVDGRTFESCVGEFNVHGPIADTLVPLPNTLLHAVSVMDKGKRIEFGLTTSGKLVTIKHPTEAAQTAQLPPVPLSSKIFRRSMRFQSITYDSKRHRLALTYRDGAGSSLAAFDISEGTWARLGKLGQPVLGMTYIPQKDEFWAVLSKQSHRRTTSYRGSSTQSVTEESSFARVDAEGKTISSTALSQPLMKHGDNQRVALEATAQLVEVDEQAVLLLSRNPRNGVNQVTGEMFVIDPESAELVHAGEIAVNNGTAAKKRRQKTRPGDSALGDIATRLASSRTAAEKLQGDAKNEFASRLKNVEALLLGQSKKSNKPRLYVVGRYSATEPVTVRVTDTSAPVVLAVCGQRAVEWKIEVDEGVNLKEIIAGGSLPQRVTKHPEGVAVRVVSGTKGFFVNDMRNLASVEALKKKLAQITDGVPISAISATHRSNDEVTVGPSNGAIRLQLVRNELDLMLAEIDRDDHRQIVTKLHEQRFFAIHEGLLPRMAENRNSTPRFWNEFSIRGPLIGHSVGVEQAQFAQHDPGSDRLFLVSNSVLTIRDVKSGKSEAIPLRSKSATLGSIVGMAFDAKRNRLLLDGSSDLMEFDLSTRKAKRIRRKTSRSRAGMVWSASRDVLFTAESDRSGRDDLRRIQRYNRHGVMLGPIELSKPIARTRYYSSRGTGMQMVDLGDHLAIIDYRADGNARLVNGRNVKRPPTGTVAVVSIETGQVVYESTLRPILEHRAMSESELANIWEQLGAEHLKDESLLWNLAAGGDDALAFLQSKYAPRDAALAEIEIAALIKDLDDNRFSTREEAFQNLRAAGSSIEPTLSGLLETGNVSSEVRERLQTLVANWSTGAPQSNVERQQVRGLEVMSRIGTPAALDMLKQLQLPEYDSLIRRYAKQSLEQDGNSAVENNPAMRFQRNLFVPR